jgi:hypothetical protein
MLLIHFANANVQQHTMVIIFMNTMGATIAVFHPDVFGQVALLAVFTFNGRWKWRACEWRGSVWRLCVWGGDVA